MTSRKTTRHPQVPIIERYHLSDDQLFKALNPDHNAIPPILALVNQGDIPAAKHALAQHFRQRPTPAWHFHPRDRRRQLQQHYWIDWETYNKIGKRQRLLVRDFDFSPAQDALNHRYNGFDYGRDIDWLDNPTWGPNLEFDKEWTTHFLYMDWWKHLSQAYWLTGDEKYAREFQFQFLDFRDKHPIPNVAPQYCPDNPFNYNCIEWRTLEIAHRLAFTWTNAFYRFLDSPSITDDTIIEQLKAFHEMMDYLYRFPNSDLATFTNNWIITESQSLYQASGMFPEFKNADLFRRTAYQRMLNEFKKQFYPDGSHWELACGYGIGVLYNFCKFFAKVRKEKGTLPPDVTDKLRQIHHYFIGISHLNTTPQFNDTSYLDLAQRIKANLPLLTFDDDIVTWAATHGRRGKAPQATTQAFPYAGQYTMRSDWTSNARFMVIKAGPFGVSHQHEDALSFEMAAFGDRQLIDPGTYTYNYDSPWRHFYTSSLNHNTAIIDGLSQNRRSQINTWAAKKPAPNLFQTIDNITVFRGTYRHGYGPKPQRNLTHTRSIYFIDQRYWLILDRFNSSDDRDHLAESLYMLNTSSCEFITAHQLHATFPHSSLQMQLMTQPDQALTVTSGQIHPIKRGWLWDHGKLIPNPAVALQTPFRHHAYSALLLYPTPKNKTAPAIKLTPAPAPGKTTIALTIKIARQDDILIIDQLHPAKKSFSFARGQFDLIFTNFFY